MDLLKRKSEVEALLKGYSVKAKDGLLSEAEAKDGGKLLDELADLKMKIKRDEDSKSLLAAISALDPEGTGVVNGSGYLRDLGKQLHNGLEQKVKTQGRPFEVKSLLAEGSLNVAVQLFNGGYVGDPHPINSVFEIIEMMKVDGEEYSYIRQTQRVNNADVVAVGATKPTSLYQWDRVSGKLKVVAHMSEPVPEYWLKDHKSLSEWVMAEMVQGLLAAFESQVMAGDGMGENMLGLLNVPGVQQQPFTVSALNSVRAAITKVELLGFVPAMILMHPTDWEAIETTTTDMGEYLLSNGPVDRSARRLWGVPVVLSLGLPAGESLVASQGTYAVALDPEFQFEWGRESDDFSRNQVRARCESRADLMVPRPTGIVKVALAAPAV